MIWHSTSTPHRSITRATSVPTVMEFVLSLIILALSVCVPLVVLHRHSKSICRTLITTTTRILSSRGPRVTAVLTIGMSVLPSSWVKALMRLYLSSLQSSPPLAPVASATPDASTPISSSTRATRLALISTLNDGYVAFSQGQIAGRGSRRCTPSRGRRGPGQSTDTPSTTSRRPPRLGCTGYTLGAWGNVDWPRSGLDAKLSVFCRFLLNKPWSEILTYSQSARSFSSLQMHLMLAFIEADQDAPG